MKSIHYKSYKVATSLPLEKIASFLNTQMQFSWKEYIVLKGNQLDLILKYETIEKQVYVFRFGCVSFVNFEDNEIHIFLQYIKSITGKINYDLIYKFFENHTLKVNIDGLCKLWENQEKTYDFTNTISHILSVILAKSTELYKFETDLKLLLNKSEKFIYFLQRGNLRYFVKKSSLIVSQILRFEYDSIHSIRIFERASFLRQNHESREIYDALSQYYELDDRFDVLTSKTSNLREIVKQYSKLSHKHSENSLILFEIFLLTLFPIFHLIHFLLDNPYYLDLLIRIFSV